MSEVRIDYNACDNTHACVAVCPMEVFDIADGRVFVKNASDCTGCSKCIENCPEGAVDVD